MNRPKAMDLIAATTMIDAAFIEIIDSVDGDDDAVGYFQSLRDKIAKYMQGETLLALLNGREEVVDERDE